MKTTISKSDWLGALGCKTYAWHGMRSAAAPPDEAALFRMQQGQEIGELARQLYPEGVFVSKDGAKTTAVVTEELIADPTTTALFEATFRDDPFVAKADILQRVHDGWHLLEVKSKYSNTSKIENLVADLAYTLMLAKRSGLQISRASLVLLSRKYRFGDTPERLFEVIDKTAEAQALSTAYEKAANSFSKTLFGETAPNPKLIPACRQCPFFADTCLGSGLSHTVLELPNLRKTKFTHFASEGIIDLTDVPDDVELTERQIRAKDSALSGTTFVGPDLSEALSSIEWPCHYLDFETVSTVLPLYESQTCFQQVLTQFSVHRKDHLDSEVQHSEYLAEAAKDSEFELAEELIQVLGHEGSIIVYSPFEATRIKALSNRFPNLIEPLAAIQIRIVDLLSIIRNNIYHPDFRGSFSIKSVLPALVPDLSYDGLECADGDTAMARFARIARNELSDAEVKSTRQSLLEYCKTDTLGMVRLHEALVELAD